MRFFPARKIVCFRKAKPPADENRSSPGRAEEEIGEKIDVSVFINAWLAVGNKGNTAKMKKYGGCGNDESQAGTVRMEPRNAWVVAMAFGVRWLPAVMLADKFKKTETLADSLLVFLIMTNQMGDFARFLALGVRQNAARQQDESKKNGGNRSHSWLCFHVKEIKNPVCSKHKA